MRGLDVFIVKLFQVFMSVTAVFSRFGRLGLRALLEQISDSSEVVSFKGVEEIVGISDGERIVALLDDYVGEMEPVDKETMDPLLLFEGATHSVHVGVGCSLVSGEEDAIVSHYPLLLISTQTVVSGVVVAGEKATSRVGMITI
jgi:hypothetical protein